MEAMAAEAWAQNLRTNAFIQSQNDQELIDFMSRRQAKALHDGFEGILGERGSQ